MVVFVQLDGSEFARWRETSVREYAADRVRAGYDDKEHSVENAENQLKSLLPDGPNTSGHYLCSVVDERENKHVGIIWYGEVPTSSDTIFIYDIRIDEGFRERGYGKAVLKLVDDRARELGKKRVALQVFAHNERARKLYEELGYKPTSVMMGKDL
jgi:RimJ/RimL family protein N-acetyltransferase